VNELHLHPLLNACLNASAAVLLVLARNAIKRGDREQHKKLMLSALGVSAVFLVSYSFRFLGEGGPRLFAGGAAAKVFYLGVLFSHMILAALVPIGAIAAVVLALKGRFATHVKLVKLTWPAWMYVSITGVVIYVMLYHWPT
jgi:putative membrane protein